MGKSLIIYFSRADENYAVGTDRKTDIKILNLSNNLFRIYFPSES